MQDVICPLADWISPPPLGKWLSLHYIFRFYLVTFTFIDLVYLAPLILGVQY